MFTALTLLVYKKLFGARCDGNPQLKYFTADDFPNLQAEAVEFEGDKGQMLRGNLYSSVNTKEPKGLVVFSHGMWGGHLSYTTEINTFAEAGYTVLGYDNTGTMASDGDNLVCFTHAMYDLQCALEFVESNHDLDGLDIILAGHSWGAYTVMMGSAFLYDRVKGTVAISGPNSPIDLFQGFLTMVLPKQLHGLIKLAKPGVKLALRLTDGKASRYCCADTMMDAEAPILILHGDQDTTVPLSASPVSDELLEDAGHIYYYCCEGKNHNPYQTIRSEAHLADKVLGMKYDEIDYDLVTEEDPEVMKVILQFMDACLEG